MKKFLMSGVRLSFFFLMAAVFLSCSQGQKYPGAEKTQIQPIEQGANAVDSTDLQKEVQVKIDAVNSGIASEEQGKALEKELNALREKVQSPELIKKIDEIIHQIEIQIVALKAKEDVQTSLTQLNNTVNTLLANISAFKSNLDSKEGVQSTIDSLNKFLSDIQYDKELIAQLIKAMGANAEWANAVKTLNALLDTLAAKGKECQSLMAAAVAKQKDYLSAVEIEAKIDQKKEAILVEIASILASASEKFDLNKINTAESLINMISVSSDINQLEVIKTKLTDLGADLKQVLENLKKKRAELLAVIVKTENLYQEALAGNYSKIKVIENYLASLKQANLDPDIAKLEKLISAISGAYISIAERERQIKEAALKTALVNEYNVLKAQYDTKVSSAQAALDEVNNALAQKEVVEAEIAKGNFSEDLLKKLADIQAVLNKTDLQAIELTISELQQQIASLKERSGTYLPEASNLASQIDQLNANIEKALENAIGAQETIADIREAITQGIQDIKNSENPAKDEIALSEGENQKISESVLRNLLRYAKVRNGEIIFYQMVPETVDKTVKFKKKVKNNNGKYEAVEKTKIVKSKKFKKVAYKKWKLDFVAEVAGNKQITLEVYESLYQNGTWTAYKKYAYIVLKDLWYDRFLDIVKKNSYDWINVMKKDSDKTEKAGKGKNK